MIYKIEFKSGIIEYCATKTEGEFNLLKEYSDEYELYIEDIERVTLISDEEAKSIMVVNTEYDADQPDDMPEELCLFDLATGDDFAIISTSEY